MKTDNDQKEPVAFDAKSGKVHYRIDKPLVTSGYLVRNDQLKGEGRWASLMVKAGLRSLRDSEKPG